MRTVWKYTLTPDRWIDIDGGDPKVVHIGIDPANKWLDDTEANLPTVWVELEPDGPDQITLMFIGTGHDVPEGTHHVGSCITPAGLVWHVYEKAT